MRKVEWSPDAESDLYDILTYWYNRNKSALFSIKLESEIGETIDTLCLNPTIGKKTNRKDIRRKLIRNYWIVYGIEETQITIHAIFDTHRNENKLNEIINKI